MGRELPIYVPDRLTEGYGPSPAAFRHLREAGDELVVTVDCGAAAYDAVAAAGEIGLEVVVIDHHLMRDDAAGGRAPWSIPNRPDCGSGQGVLAAAGRHLRAAGGAEPRGARGAACSPTRAEPDLRQWLDLAALGAICDVTQLAGFNRALAAQGLKVMSAWANPGPEGADGRSPAPRAPASVFHAGFILGPRINAGGRIGRSDLGARLLSTDDPAEARTLAAGARRAQRRAQGRSRRQILERPPSPPSSARPTSIPTRPAIVVAREDWHPGVIGIVASRLRERYRRPVVVIGLDPRRPTSARAPAARRPGVNLGRAIQAAFDEGLLLAGGGHAMAAGLTAAPVGACRSCAPSSASAWPARWPRPRPRTRSRSTPW